MSDMRAIADQIPLRSETTLSAISRNHSAGRTRTVCQHRARVPMIVAEAPQDGAMVGLSALDYAVLKCADRAPVAVCPLTFAVALAESVFVARRRIVECAEAHLTGFVYPLQKRH
jgi:hypothetical protein